MGKEVDTDLFKKRKGFRFIVINDEIFQFNWASKYTGSYLILYDIDQKKYEIPWNLWHKVEHSEEYKESETKISEVGLGKAEAAELFRKYLKNNSTDKEK